MLERATGQFSIDGQVEEILGGMGEAARIARISQSCRFSGQLEGESIAEFTAVLPREGDGSFHGFQRIAGRLGEREGTFVLSVTGAIHNGQPRGNWTIVPKSGSGDFVNIRGGGDFSLPNGKPGAYRLEFDLRKPRTAKTPAIEAKDAALDTIDRPGNSSAIPPSKRSRKKADVTEPIALPASDLAPVRNRRSRAA